MTPRRPFVLGLTGSMGMGKSTTAGFFRDVGIPVWDADEAVHRLYERHGAAVGAILDIYPQAVGENGVDRAKLREWIAKDATAISQIEKCVHPLVAKDRHRFLQKCQAEGRSIVVLDIPLLFETGGDEKTDATLVVTTDAREQKRRVLERATMTPAQFTKILQTQMPDSEKRARADFVIETKTPQQAKEAVEKLVDTLKRRATYNA